MNPQDKPTVVTGQANGTRNVGETLAPRLSRREWFRQIARGAAVAALIGGGAWLGRHGVGGADGETVRRTLAPCPSETLGFCPDCSRRSDCALPSGVDFRARTGVSQGGAS
jgi:hypothetical protein